jgi:hypothetical protein
MFTGPRAITVLATSEKDSSVTKQIIATSLHNSALSLMLATSNDTKKVFEQMQSKIKQTAKDAWKEVNSWMFADKINAESILCLDFQKKYLVAESGIDKVS